MEGKSLQQLGSALRARREAMGLSQEAFADKVGMHRTYYSSIELGKKNITVKMLERVTKALQTKPSVVFAEASL